MCLYQAYTLHERIQSLQIGELTFWAFTCTILMALQDIAVDGWVVTILNKEFISYGAMTQTIGLTLGGLFSYNFFVLLNSVEYSNKYFYATTQSEPILSIPGFWKINAVFVFAIAFIVHFVAKEKNPSHDEFSSLWEPVKNVRKVG